MVVRTLAVVLALLSLSPAPITIRLSRTVYMAGSGASIAIYCRVEKNENNRKLWWGFVDYTSSERQLEGESAAVNYGPFLYSQPDLDCGTATAFCEVGRADGKHFIAKQDVEITGCQQ